MIKSASTLLKGCLKCGMQFDNYEHLANHQKNFCVDGDYGSIQKLENKYQEYTSPKTDRPHMNPKIGGSAERSTDFQRIYNQEAQNREAQWALDINRIKQEKAALRLKKDEDQEALADLMRESEQNKEKTMRTRVEKEQIKRELVDLDKNKLKYLEEEKKGQLEKLAAQREQLKQAEHQLNNDLMRYENEMKTMNKIREDDIKRQDDALEKFKRRGDENFKVQDYLMQERSDRVAELKMRRENLEFEKQRLMEEQERMKNGDFSGSKRPNYGLFAANQMLNTINAIKNYDIGSARQAINSDQQRINDMKNEQRNIVRNEHIYPDYLHSSPPSNKVNPIPISLLNPSPNYGSPERPGTFMSNPKKGPTASPFANNANNILTPRLLTASQSMTNIHQPLLLPGGLPDGAQPQSLSEVLQAKAKYINSGGQDPVALRNFENLEHYYKGVETRRAANGLDSERSQANPQLQELIDKQDHENLKIKHEIEMLKIQKTKVPPANGQGGSFTIADMNLKLNGINPNGKKMFNIYSAGNEFFIQNEARCVDLDEYERMAVNIEAQEVDALRMLSQLPIGTELYRFKLEQFKELSQSRAEMEKIIQEQRLLEMRRGFEVVRRKEDINYENKKWVDEQRKNIIANRLRKNLNPTKVAKGYDPSEGLVIHWDYLLSVPKRNDRCQIVYGIYINGNEVYPPSMLEPHPTEIDTSVTNRCIFGKSHPVADIPANANALLIFEVQLFPSKDSTNPRLTSFGWSQLDLFDARRELKRGKFKVPLYECPTDTNQDIDGIRDLVPVQNGVSWLYLRISYPFDDDIGKVSSIYPENTHMEYNIPQIHLRNFRPAAEGQFTSIQYGGYPQEMQPYTRNITPQTYPPQQSVYPPPHQPQQSPPVEQPHLTQTQFMPPPAENTTVDDRKSTFHGDQTGIPGNTLNQTASVESQDVSTISRAPRKKPGKGKKGGKGKDSDRSIRKPKNGNTSSINQTKMSGKEIELIYDPFIPNDKPQYIDRTFEKGMGVDFYIDGCRFLPDNVTVVKIAVQIVTVDFDIIKNAESNLPDLSVSTTYNPLFNFRVEIRPQTFNPTALAFISIDTIDKASNETKIVGYAGINLFINRFTAKQPESQNDTDIVLLSGNYQLPIYCQEPFRTKPFNMEKVESLERLPTASILVRIRQAPLSDDGLRVLNLRDVPPKEWAARQIWVPRPAYAAKAYNTSYYKVRDSEKELFNIRQGKEDPPLRETAQLLLNAENINKEMEDEEMVLYLDDKINRNSSTGLIDLLYFARYRPEAGFKFALDGLHNISTAQPYIGLYSLNPPGNFYVYDDGDEPDVSKLQLNSVLDWDGPLMSPKFLDGYMTFKDIPFHKNLNLVVDIRTVNLMKHPPQFSQIGWTIVPVFTPDGFVLSGIYQVPVIAGEVNKAIVQELEGTDPWEYILDQIKAKKIKWLGQTSIMIRLVDAQREGHYEQSWDFTRVDYRYLPKKELQKYAYNNNADAKAKTGKLLKSIVPNKGNPQAYQKRITEAFVKELGLTQYQVDG